MSAPNRLSTGASDIQKPRKPESRLLSAQAAADYTGWPYTTLRDAALRGNLPCLRIPGQNRMWFDRRDLDRAIEAWKARG
jgi:hypothetical protein